MVKPLYASFCPPIQPPVLNRLGQVLLMDIFFSRQISNRPRQLKNPRKAACREAELVGDLLQKRVALFIELTEAPDVAGLHLAVGVQAEGRKALTLDLTGGVDTLADDCAAFSQRLVGQVLVRDARHLDMEIDAIEEWTEEAAAVTLQHRRGAGATAGGITAKATGTGMSPPFTNNLKLTENSFKL